MEEMRDTVKENIEKSVKEKKVFKTDKKIKITQEVIEIRTASGAVKQKYIEIKKYPNGHTERRVVGLKKNGKIVFDKGIK